MQKYVNFFIPIIIKMNEKNHELMRHELMNIEFYWALNQNLIAYDWKIHLKIKFASKS